jgi:hypothetical protein
MFIDPQNNISPWADPKLVPLPEIIRVFKFLINSIQDIDVHSYKIALLG